MAVKKTKRTAALPMLKESAQQIWLAGLGAFAMAGEGGGRLFQTLVKKGNDTEKLNKKRLEQVLYRAEQVQGDAKHALTRFTRPIEKGVGTAMNSLGVPTRREIQTLTKRVEELTRVVQQSRAKGARKAGRARRAAAQAVGAE